MRALSDRWWVCQAEPGRGKPAAPCRMREAARGTFRCPDAAAADLAQARMGG